ncbi:MAG: hypothetical protein WCK49_05360 [Myxococcaceae bacterium]
MKGLFLLLLSTSVLAWENHALPTVLSVSKMPEFKNAKPIKAESLENFLKSDRKSFLRTIRVNPNMLLPLYLQELPGTQRNPKKSYFLPSEVSLLPNSLTKTEHNFVKVKEGELVSPLDVFVSATDEPDYGLDIGLFDLNYGFGEQPFGNPKLEFSSQAPFHMGFYHEPAITYWVAPYFARTFPEYRIGLYFKLSQNAFATGHPYWGWRFAGWGAHYIQDLTQPYHSTLSPGTNTAWMLLAGLLDICGVHGPKANLVQEATDKHLAIENHMYREALEALSGNNTALVFALSQKEPESLRYEPRYIRNNLTLESHALSGQLAEVLDEKLLLKLMANFGNHTRAWVRSVVVRSS